MSSPEDKPISNQKVRLKLRTILHQTNFCAICLENGRELNNLKDFTVVNSLEENCMSTLNDMLRVIFGEKLPSTLPSELICEECKLKLVDAYLFIINTQCTARIVEDCIEQINSKIDETTRRKNLEIYDNIVINLQDPRDFCNFIKNSADDSDSFSEENKEYMRTNVKPKEKKDIIDERFSCDHCSLEFKSKRGISSHITAIHNNLATGERVTAKLVKTNAIKCPECQETNCVHKKYLISFKKQIKLSKGLVKCIDCDYKCTKRRFLLAHVNRDHLKKFTCVCDLCSKIFHSKLAYKAHFRSFHTVWLNCQYCDMKFKQQPMLKIHQNLCSQEKRQYQCDKCPASFSGTNKLAYHKKKHLQQFPCKLCLKVFSEKRTLNQHILGHSTNLTKTYSCSYCDIKFKTLALRKNHDRLEHGNEKLKCNLCNLEFATPKHFRWHKDTVQHQKKLNPAVKFRFECEYCDYSTKATEMLEAHVNRYHLKIAPYECNICQRKFTGAKLLKGHMKSHEGVKKQCEVCGSNLGGPSALKRHMRLHTGETPYSCDVCGDKFSNTCLKNIHLTKKHSVKSVACPLCNSMFYSLSLMRFHFKKQHWKSKEKFDFRKVPELKEEFYDLFRDRRRVVF